MASAFHKLKLIAAKRQTYVLHVALLSAVLIFLARQNQIIRQHASEQTQNTFAANAHYCPEKRHETAAARPESFCDILPEGVSASWLWRKNFDKLLEASIHPLDVDRVHEGWTRQLLETVSPYMLERALLSYPSAGDLKYVLDVIHRRMQNTTAPPLRVVIFGGSVTEGTMCDELPREVQLSGRNTRFKGKQCAWPYRLQLLADHFLGSGVVEIHNVGVGGTNSLLALPVLGYRLYSDPGLLQFGSDVIVNGYAVNDNLPGWENRVNSTATLLQWNSALHSAQKFVETALKSQLCRRQPALLFLNEYIGNQNELIMGEDIRNDAVRVLADYYGFAYASAIHPIKELVLANNQETFFSPQWWRRGKHLVNGHFQMPGHVHVALSIAYALLRSTVDFCDQIHGAEDEAFTNAGPIDFSIPPHLTKGLKSSDLLNTWEAKAAEDKRHAEEYCASASSGEAPCPFAFVATPAGTTRHAKALNRYLKPFITNNTGWSGENDMRNGWQNKLGLVTHKHGAKLEFTVPNISNRIKVITLHWLKSYGERWEDSVAEFKVSIFNGDALEYEDTFVQPGAHNLTVSIAYSHVLDLRDHAAEVGRTVKMTVTMIRGSEYKIMALMMCSR